MIKIKLSSIPGEDDGAKFRCPVAGLEFNGKYKFFALRNCGHVLSAKALKEVKSSTCLVCHEEFAVEKASAKVDKNGKVANGNKNVNGGAAAAKRFKATDIAPANATEV
ncbi:replication termination factor 2, partial [Trifolium medium]|nr:replication termination factor 2 [Trifolium medium]